MSGITPATCTSRMCTCCVPHRRRSIWADLSEEWVRWCLCMANVPSSSLSDVSRSVGLRTEAADLPMWPQPGWCACGSITNEQTVMIHRRLKRAMEYHWKLSQRGTFMTFLQTKPGLPFIPPPLHYCNQQASFHWGEPLSCLDAILRCSVSICHLPIYISCYYLLGLGLHAVSLGVLDFHRHELSAEEGSSRNHGATRWCFSSGCPIYQNPKWFQFCGTQQNEEYLMTSIFISTLCYICLPVVVFNLPWDRWGKKWS